MRKRQLKKNNKKNNDWKNTGKYFRKHKSKIVNSLNTGEFGHIERFRIIHHDHAGNLVELTHEQHLAAHGRTLVGGINMYTATKESPEKEAEDRFYDRRDRALRTFC
jgi:hypothetical protein